MLPRPGSKDIDRDARLEIPPVASPSQPPEERVRNFDEVRLPWTSKMAVREASRCLQCHEAACVKACPLKNDIPLILWLTEHGDLDGAIRVLRETNNMPEICGRICSRGEQCEAACPVAEKGKGPVAVGRIEAFLGDRHRKRDGWEGRRPLPSGRQVAVVGAGPAGLTVAELLRQRGHSVIVFDEWPGGGGSLRYGMPRFKLDHGLVNKRLRWLRELGVEFVHDTRIEGGEGIDDLFRRAFDAVFLGTGAGLPVETEIEGRGFHGVHEAMPFLTRANVEQNLRPSDMEDPPSPGDRVAVVGRGPLALNCARTAIRLGATEVTCFVEGAPEEMKGDLRDVELAREEGVRFRWEARPLRFEEGGDGCVDALVHASEEGRERRVEVDTVVLARGTRPDPALTRDGSGLRAREGGFLRVDPGTGRTTRESVWAGGGNVTGPGSLARTVAQARTAAWDIHARLSWIP
jgi:glutamate synthase (NADPH/NADH) small chain